MNDRIDLDIKVKKNFSIPRYQYRILKKIKRHTGISMSTIVENALRDYLGKYGNLIRKEDWEVLFDRIARIR